MSAEELFAAASERLLASSTSVCSGRMLHAPGLRTGAKFFAFVSQGDLFVKLPAERVSGLLANGDGRPCELRQGSPMREWVRLVPADEDVCTAYMLEALDFVATQAPTARKRKRSRPAPQGR